MYVHSLAQPSALRRNLRWLWLLVPAAVIVAAIQSFLVLQLLSAILLFAVLFLAFAAVVAVFLLLLVALDRILGWSLRALTPLGRSFRSSLRDFRTSPGQRLQHSTHTRAKALE